MSSYVITGASRGIGLEFVRQLSAVPENKVFALVRNKNSADKLTALEGGNVYVLQADVTDHRALKAAASQVADVTGGTLDVLINNAAALAGENDWRTAIDFQGEEDLLDKEFDHTFKVNVVGVIHSTNAFLPLLRKGYAKKVITISSSGGERDFVSRSNLTGMAAYGASKAAVSMIVLKYALLLKSAGFVCLALCPGLVDVSETAIRKPSEKEMELVANFVQARNKENPDALKTITPAQSVKNLLAVMARSGEEDSGKFISTAL